MDFKILAVFKQDCHLIVRVEHYNVDDSFWFIEHYRWRGRQGLQRKRLTDSQGYILLSDLRRAPRRRNSPKASLAAYLPAGAEWAYKPPPIMVDESIIGVITSIHKRRLISGWPERTDRLGPSTFNDRDQVGCSFLVSVFQHLVGKEFTV